MGSGPIGCKLPIMFYLLLFLFSGQTNNGLCLMINWNEMWNSYSLIVHCCYCKGKKTPIKPLLWFIFLKIKFNSIFLWYPPHVDLILCCSNYILIFHVSSVYLSLLPIPPLSWYNLFSPWKKRYGFFILPYIANYVAFRCEWFIEVLFWFWISHVN